MSIDKNKIKEWLKDPYNLIFLLILILAISARFYYFDLTKNQPVWWDESEYLSAAKDFSGIVPYQLGSQRNAAFPLLISVFYDVGIKDETVLRFLLLLVPSILVILLIYLCAKEMYLDKRIALISMALATVLWEHLFYSNRFHTENFSLIFGFIGIYLIFKSYLKKEKVWFIKPEYSIIYIMTSMIMAFLFRTGNIIFAIQAVAFFLIISKANLFKKKEAIYGAIIGAILILAQLGYNYLSRGDIIKGYLTYITTQYPLAWNSLMIFKYFYESLNPAIPSILYYLFVIGIIFLLIELYAKRNKLLKLDENSEDLELKSDVFNILIIIITLFMFIVIDRVYTGYEYRWFFPLIIGMFVFTAKAIITISEYVVYFISEKNKIGVIILILVLLLPGLYYEMQHADMITQMKLESYSQVRDAALWMKENSNRNDTIFSISQPQTTYYSERKTVTYSSTKNETELYELINKNKPKYITVSVFEPHPQYIYELPQKNNQTFMPINILFIDKEKKQMALIIYAINYENAKNMINP